MSDDGERAYVHRDVLPPRPSPTALAVPRAVYLRASSSAESLGHVSGLGRLITSPARPHTGQDTRARSPVVLSRKTISQVRQPTCCPRLRGGSSSECSFVSA